MQKLMNYIIGLLVVVSIVIAGDHGHNSHSVETINHQTTEHNEEHSEEGVTGNVIMHHMLDDRVFEIFNPFNITHPITIELYPEGGKPFLGINKQVVMMWLNTLLIILLFTIGYKKNKKVQSGMGNFLEVLVVFIRDEVVYINMGEKQGRRFLPLILTFFFFILTMNLMGLIPGTTTPTANINVTAALAIITFFTYLIFGNKDFWKHIFATPGVPLWLLPIMIPVELLGLLTKPFALAVRLFANMNAGHIIILAFLGIIINLQNYWVALGSVPMAIAINLLEIFVAFLQAYVFSLLSTIFISMAVAEHEEHEAH